MKTEIQKVHSEIRTALASAYGATGSGLFVTLENPETASIKITGVFFTPAGLFAIPPRASGSLPNYITVSESGSLYLTDEI